MTIFTGWTTLPKDEEIVLTIGTFDGLHLGHQMLLRALSSAQQGLSAKNGNKTIKTAVISFYKPPREHITKQKELLITSFENKCRLMTQEIDYLFVLPFEPALQQMTPREFIQKLCSHMQVKKIILGHGAMFGKDRQGTESEVKKICQQVGVDVEYLPKCSTLGQEVSSTRIRRAIQNGDFTTARQLLGRDFFINAVVAHGKALGGQITSIKTANLHITDLVIPPLGVYCVRARTEDGVFHPAVANLGVAPTLQKDRAVLCEVHLLDGEFELYSQELHVTFHKFLREEKFFSSVEDLKTQIHVDIRAATNYWQQGII